MRKLGRGRSCERSRRRGDPAYPDNSSLCVRSLVAGVDPDVLHTSGEYMNEQMKTCKKCGGTEFYANRHCKQCLKITINKYRVANPELYKQIHLQWHRNNPNKSKVAHAEYYAANAGKIKARVKELYLLNREAKLSATRKWQAANPEKVKEILRRARHNRRARKLGSSGTLSKGLTEKLFKLQGGICVCCGMPLGNDFHLDHIMPLALGGENKDANMQLLRKDCNQEKHAKHPINFMQSRGFLL